MSWPSHSWPPYFFTQGNKMGNVQSWNFWILGKSNFSFSTGNRWNEVSFACNNLFQRRSSRKMQGLMLRTSSSGLEAVQQSIIILKKLTNTGAICTSKPSVFSRCPIQMQKWIEHVRSISRDAPVTKIQPEKQLAVCRTMLHSSPYRCLNLSIPWFKSDLSESLFSRLVQV